MTNIDRRARSRPTLYPHIVRTPGHVDGEPRIDGTGIGVRHVVQIYRYDGSIDAVLRAYPHISASQVREALAYYEDHVAEIEQYIVENDC